jgi:hypothetical protein
MAVEPLYNESKDDLLTRVRIKTADEEQTLALVDQVIQEVRLGFFSALGKDRAKEIAAYSYSDNPDTDQEILRVNGAVTEANWVTYLLVQRLPVIYMADRGATSDQWNEEPLTRDSGYIEEFLKNLKEEIDKGLGQLEEPVNANSGAVKSSLNLPDDSYIVTEEFKGLPSGRNTTYYG